jgi:SAM-dependent methyltransferase
MSFEATKRHWELLARTDPLWAICSDPAKRNGRWDLDEFFRLGELEVDAVFRRLADQGTDLPHRDAGLDFGCGVGRLTRALSRRLDHVVGVDASATMIARARELHAGFPKSLEFVHNEEPHLGVFPDERFSFIYSSLVLQHIPYPASLAYVGEMMRVLRPGGLLVFQVPTEDRTNGARKLLRGIVLRAARLLRLPPVGPIAGLYVDMHVLPEAQVLERVQSQGCRVEDRAPTNSSCRAFDGRLKYDPDVTGEPLVSTQFIIRKPVAPGGGC